MAIVRSGGELASLHRPSWGLPSSARAIRLHSGQMRTYAELYRRQPNLRIVVRFLARNIGQLGLGAYRRVSDTERVRLGRTHPIGALVHRPRPRLTRNRWVAEMVSDLAIYDQHAALKVRDADTGKLSLWRLPPQITEPKGANWIEPESFEVAFNRGRREFDAADVVWIHGYNPDDPRTGASPIESLRQILAGEESAAEWREQFWRGGARISGVITRPAEPGGGKWDPDARERFVEEWAASWTGADGRLGRTPVLEDGMEWKEATFSPKDAEYLGARKLSREECAAAYFIPPVFVGILEHANFANVREQHKSLYQDTLGPHLDQLTSEIEMQVIEEEFSEPDAYLDFNIEEKLRGSFEEQSAAIQTATGAPWMLRNEARALRNLPPVPGGDVLVVPLNVLEGGQASPTDSAPPPTPDPTTASRCSHGRKGLADLPADVRGWRAQHEGVLRNFFDRQRQAVMSALGAGAEIAAAWDEQRWNDELRNDMLGLAVEMADQVGGSTAERFGGEWDADLAFAWLHENARIASESINAATIAALDRARSGVNAARALVPEDLEEDEDDSPLGRMGSVFALAASVRAVQISISRTTGVSNFARFEGARQSGTREKVWNVNSSNSRHGDLNGETVAMGELFSNGLRWPGDAAGAVDDTAGCVCSLDFNP